MNQSHDDSRQSLVTVAQAVRTRGLKGEIVAELLTDFPERFGEIDQLIAVSPGGVQSIVEIEDFWLQKNRVVLKLIGYDDTQRAKELIGSHFAVPESERVELPENQYYDWELEGCTVKLKNGKVVGAVKSVLRTGGPEILAVAGKDRSEYLVPLAEEIVIQIDPATRTIIIDPPSGLLDL